MRRRKLTVATLATAGALLVGGGTALADDGDKGARCDAFIAKIAEKRGVSVEQLTADFKARVVALIDAAEKAGKLTSEQAAAKRAKVAEATGCKGFAKKVKRGHAKRASAGFFAGALTYLDLPRDELKAELKKGTTLAQLAEAKGGVDGLKKAMLAKANERLAAAVANGKITEERSTKILERLEKMVDKLVDRSFVKKTT
jgi:(p)ppGpp synthase/HD superfamily hydrolase